MISGSTSCFPNPSQGLQMYAIPEDHHLVSQSSLDQPNSAHESTHSNSLLYSLSVLKEKVHQVQSLVTIFISPHQNQPPESTAIAIASMGTLIQEIIVTASSMMFTCQQMTLTSSPPTTTNTGTGVKVTNCVNNNNSRVTHVVDQERGQASSSSQPFFSNEILDWYGDSSYNNTCTTNENINRSSSLVVGKNNTNDEKNEGSHSQLSQALSPKNYDIIELDAADLLAKYTHYCQVCGKGFKRDANLRMHMRAHGDEYKSSAALSNPTKNNNNNIDNNNNSSGIGSDNKETEKLLPRKYSCPQEGCRWNKKHAKFQPLKSMICVKNHYKRSHCPKMYVCKRCNRKQFSVLSDLRTHEKHCGDLRWQCSCGTTFSRKDKLMGHVALFVGHTPAINSLMKMGKVDQGQMRVDNINR